MTSGTRDLSCTPNRVSPVAMYLSDDPFDAYVCRMHCPWHEDLSSCTGPLGAFLDLALAIIPKWNYSQRSFFCATPHRGGLFGPASLSRTFLRSFRVDLLGAAEPDVLTGPTTPGKVRNQLTLVPLRSEVIPHIIDKTRQEVIPRRWV